MESLHPEITLPRIGRNSNAPDSRMPENFTMHFIRQHIRPIVQGGLGALLILYSLPAIYRAMTAFQPRIIVGLFFFLVALVYSRDRARIDARLRKLWSTRNVH